MVCHVSPSLSLSPSPNSQAVLIGSKQLELPKKMRNFLISPPTSPPVGWEQTQEAPPTMLDYKLVSALASLQLPGVCGCGCGCVGVWVCTCACMRVHVHVLPRAPLIPPTHTHKILQVKYRSSMRPLTVLRVLWWSLQMMQTTPLLSPLSAWRKTLSHT